MKQQKKSSDRTLLLPGSDGWDLWKGSEQLTLVKNSGERDALSVDGIPGGELIMAFPIRDVTAAPFVAATADETMFDDLAELHLERSGLRTDDSEGRLADTFRIGSSQDESVLLPVVLAPPPEGGLPKKSPKGFDVSARCFRCPESAVILWREFGRWVFAVSNQEARVIYFQALPSALLDEQLHREVKLGLAQLSMQNILGSHIIRAVIWSNQGENPPSAEAISALGEALSLRVDILDKPAPLFPEVLSRLLPADIRAERITKRKAQRTRLAVFASILLYLGLIGFLGYRYFEETKALEVAKRRANHSSPEAEAIAEFYNKWGELQPIVENEFWPVELFFNAYQSAPKKGLKILRAEMRNEFQVDSQGQVLKRGIILQGESEEAEQAIQFDENLKSNEAFSTFQWKNGSPNQTKSDTWGFTYTGEPISGI